MSKLFFSHSQPECFTAALQCFETELQTVRRECDDPQDVINYTEEFLEMHISAQQAAARSGVSVRKGRADEELAKPSRLTARLGLFPPAGTKLHPVPLRELV